MNNLERLLHQQGKKMKQQEQELNDINRRYQELQTKLNQEEEKNKILQCNIDKLTLIEFELRRQIKFVEAQRDNLLEQLKSLHEYNFSMIELQKKNQFNKMRTVKELTITQNEYQKQEQQLLKLQIEKAQLISEIEELKTNNLSLNEQIKIYPLQIQKLRQNFIELMKERDHQILQLDEKIEQLKKQKQKTEENCDKIEFEENDITEDTNSNQDGYLYQQTLNDNIEIIKNMKIADQEKQKTILQLTEQVTLLQVENQKQRQLLTTQQLTQLYPQDIQLQIRRLQQLRGYIPQFTTKIAILQIKQQEINELKQNYMDLLEQYQKETNIDLSEFYQKHQKELNKYKNKYQNKKQKLSNIQKQFSNVLSENWKLKEKLIDILKDEESVKQFIQNLSNELCFDEYPFESLNELLISYNKIRSKLMSYSEQKHFSLI
ncbi:unnamed protein product [Paramecium pentaurelia]|uniref:Uncharacterized protein n=1 Tax=Paramecium pentaurelia TaxID=43138 RepID=A0A8S1VHB5_9CILI|nr:unnamed protein product [Paramecium pentaurelia]